ncbi:MAG: alpha/beta hydrolase fold domain-containing protein [Anaerolineaceae bacterium]
MRRLFVITIILLITMACSFSPFATDTAPTSSQEPSETTPPVVHPTLVPKADMPVFNSSKLDTDDKDITYCTMDGVELKMDVYYPRTADNSWPLVIYIHGGGWVKGDKELGAGAVEIAQLKKAGFLVASINYRLAPEFQFPAQIQDVKCAVRHFRAHASEYNLNPEKIGVWGGSAGGHLVSLLGTSDESAGWEVGEYLDQSSRVQAVVDMFGPADLYLAFESEPGFLCREVFGATSNSDPVLAQASPVTYVSPDDPPFLILHGDQDNLVPVEHSEVLYEKLQAAGVPSELVIVKNAGHGFKPMDGKAIDPTRFEISTTIQTFFEENLK